MPAAATRSEAALARLAIVVGVMIPSVPVAGAQSNTLQGVIEAASGGRFRDALELAQAETDPTLRAQAEVWLYIRASDFERAQQAAFEGLAHRPDDPWLAERAGAAALAQRDGPRARQASEALARILATMPAEQRSTWDANAESLAAGVQRWLEDENRTTAALKRARWCGWIAFGACLAACVWLARPSARVSQRS